MNGIHYHNSLKGSSSGSMYNPSIPIISDPLADKYTVGENIGRGKFAVVKKCTNIETKEEFAAKFIKKRRRGKSCREEILREVVMLEKALDHPRLVDLMEVYETSSELVLITEYCSGGELFTECVLEESFNEADVRLLMSQILEGLVYLHDKNIVHLDLKPQNILLTKPFPEGSVKICDLGFACLVNTGEDIRDIIGTPDYVAPEVLNYDPLGLYTDMWSLGVLTYVMLTTYSPFAGNDKNETFCNITAVKLDFPSDLFEQMSNESQDFIRKLLLADPDERMTAKECQEHPWIMGVAGPSRMLISPHPQPGTSKEQELEPSLSTETAENQIQATKEPITEEDTVSRPIGETVTVVGSEQVVLQGKTTEIANDSDSGMVNDSNSVSPVETLKRIVPRSSSTATSDLSLTECDLVNDIELTSDRDSNLDVEEVDEMNKSASEKSSEIHPVEQTTTQSQGFDFQENVMSEDMQTGHEKDDRVVLGEDMETTVTSTSPSSALAREDNVVECEVHIKDAEIGIGHSDKRIANTEFLKNDFQTTDHHGDHDDMEMLSNSLTEKDICTRLIGDFNQNSVDKDTRGGHSEEPHRVHESRSMEDIPTKRPKCENLDSSMASVSSNNPDEEDYEYVSVSNRVRIFETSFEQTNSPGKSPGRSPKSPRITPKLNRRSSKI